MLKMKRFSVLLKVLTVLAMVLMVFAMWFTPATTASAADPTETMNIFGSTGVKASDSSSISWTGEHFTFTNNKASSSTAIRTSDSDHYRVYTKSTCTLSANNGELISKVVITSTSSSYVSGCSPTSGTKTTSGATITITFTEAVTEVAINSTAQWRLKKIVVTYTEASNDCAHTSVSTVYDSATEEHYQQCIDCKTEIEGTREACAFGEATPNSIGGGKHTLTQVCDTCQGEKVTTKACSEFTEGDWETADGVHTRTLTCTLCGGDKEESGDCQISEGEWVREGDEHSKTGTCTVCGDSTTVTEACTLEYENIPNNNGTHNTISTCSVCNQSATEENVACTFEKSWNVGDTVLTYTCKYCGYSYTEEATLYTVTYSVPEGVEAPAAAVVAEGYTTKLPTAANSGDYTFVGWTNVVYSQNVVAPKVVYDAGEDLEVSENITLYALYTYAEGTGNYKKVTANQSDWSGEYLIVYESGTTAYIFNGVSATNAYASATISNSIIEKNDEVEGCLVTIATMEGGYSILTKNGYISGASSSNKMNFNTTTPQLNVITFEDNSITIKSNGSPLQFNNATNNGMLFRYYYKAAQQAICLYAIDGNTYYTTSFDTVCEHTDTRVETVAATCTEAGVERTICNVCGAPVAEVEIPALGHDYSGENGFCVNGCGEQDPARIDYSGYYYISFTHSGMVYYADNSQLSSNRYYARTEVPAVDSVTTKYVFRLEKTATGIYSLYELDGDLYQNEITVEKVGGVYRFYATVGEDACMLLFNNNNNGETKYVKFYKASNATQSNYAQDVTLTPVTISANIDEATLTLSDDVAVNYYVEMSDVFAEAKMNFTVNGETYDVEGKAVDGKYVFTLNLPPQLMAENISAVLVCNDVELDRIENYSIQQYAINKLNDAGSSDKLKQLVSDMLHYGAAAQEYRGYKTDNLANKKTVVTNILPASTAEPTETDRTIVNNPDITEYPAYFTGVNVWFDAVNKIIIKVNKTENVTLSIDEGEDVAVTSTTIYTEGILATDFNKTYTFVLKCDGVVMQTLTYSVNAYVYAALAEGSGASDAMKDLARALYNYGASAEAYGA